MWEKQTRIKLREQNKHKLKQENEHKQIIAKT